MYYLDIDTYEDYYHDGEPMDWGYILTTVNYYGTIEQYRVGSDFKLYSMDIHCDIYEPCGRQFIRDLKLRNIPPKYAILSLLKKNKFRIYRKLSRLLGFDRQDLIDNYKYFIKSNFTNISKEDK